MGYMNYISIKLIFKCTYLCTNLFVSASLIMETNFKQSKDPALG